MLKSLFVYKLKDALQSSENKYHMLKGEIISIVKETGFSGENIEEIIDTCWNDIIQIQILKIIMMKWKLVKIYYLTNLDTS